VQPDVRFHLLLQHKMLDCQIDLKDRVSMPVILKGST
jgi:hypothetical protein